MNTSGDADLAPLLAKLPLTCMNFQKPVPDPIPLPREPILETPVPQKDLKELKETFEEVGASTANLLYELDSALELAYAIEQSLDQGETVEETLTSVGIGKDTVEYFDSLLQAILQQLLPIAQHVCKFSKGGPASGIRLQTRCISHKLDGLSKLSKGLHKVVMHHLKAQKHAITSATWYK